MQERRRKDQWTLQDDENLAEIVIQSVQNGKTQLEAFEIAAEKLGRTKQACGFRWNKTLRAQYGQVLFQERHDGYAYHNRCQRCKLHSSSGNC